MVTMINDYLKDNKFDANEISNIIAEKAFKDSLDEAFDSPFSREARRSGLRYDGGKSDDISIVVGLVQIGTSVNTDTSVDSSKGAVDESAKDL